MKVPRTGYNLTAKIVSVIFALVLWLIIMSNSSFTYKATLPINYVGPSEGYIMTGEYPEDVLVRISGTGKELLLFSLRGIINPERRYALVNLNGLIKKGKHQIDLDNSNINLANDGLEVEKILKNAFFSVVIDRIITRVVTIDVENLPLYHIEKGFVSVGKPRARPEKIIIRGPEDILENMESVKITSLAGTRISPEDPVLNAKLGKDLSDFVMVDPESVELHFSVEPLTQKVFNNVPLVLIKFPRNNVPLFTPDTFSVNVKGPESIVSRLKPDDILVTVRYKIFLELSSSGKNLLKPEVRFPEGISVILIPEVVRFSDNSAKS